VSNRKKIIEGGYDRDEVLREIEHLYVEVDYADARCVYTGDVGDTWDHLPSVHRVATEAKVHGTSATQAFFKIQETAKSMGKTSGVKVRASRSINSRMCNHGLTFLEDAPSFRAMTSSGQAAALALAAEAKMAAERDRFCSYEYSHQGRALIAMHGGDATGKRVLVADVGADLFDSIIGIERAASITVLVHDYDNAEKVARKLHQMGVIYTAVPWKEGCLDNMRFDLVVMNPPFSDRKATGSEQSAGFYVRFLQAIIETKPGRFLFFAPPITWQHRHPNDGSYRTIEPWVEFVNAPPASLVEWVPGAYRLVGNREDVLAEYGRQHYPGFDAVLHNTRSGVKVVLRDGEFAPAYTVDRSTGKGRLFSPGEPAQAMQAVFSGPEAREAAQWFVDHSPAVSRAWGMSGHMLVIKVSAVRAVIDGAKRRK
jgi:hypothetical protein